MNQKKDGARADESRNYFLGLSEEWLIKTVPTPDFIRPVVMNTLYPLSSDGNITVGTATFGFNVSEPVVGYEESMYNIVYE